MVLFCDTLPYYLLQITNFSICNKQHLELISEWSNVVGSPFRTTGRNQDLDMKLKVKLQKPTNKIKKKKEN